VWLRGLGLERYEPAFGENEIDAELWPKPTEPDPKALGLPVGPGRTLLQPIAALRESGLPSPLAEPPSETFIPGVSRTLLRQFAGVRVNTSRAAG
jgi:hypothetical protein